MQGGVLLKVIRFEKNRGLGEALKVAIEKSSYELIARMDSDDISVANRFEQQLRLFDKNEKVDIVGGDISEFIGYENNIVGTRAVPTDNADIRQYMKNRCAMNHVSVMYKKQAVQAAGGYLDWFWNEDYYLWIRMLLKDAVFSNTGTVLVKVRVGKDMYARRGGDKYFKSEIGIQKLMLEKGIIDKPTYILNCAKRFVVQKMLPNNIRGWVFRKFARK